MFLDMLFPGVREVGRQTLSVMFSRVSILYHFRVSGIACPPEVSEQACFPGRLGYRKDFLGKKNKTAIRCFERVFHFTKIILKKTKSGLDALSVFFIRLAAV